MNRREMIKAVVGTSFMAPDLEVKPQKISCSDLSIVLLDEEGKVITKTLPLMLLLRPEGLYNENELIFQFIHNHIVAGYCVSWSGKTWRVGEFKKPFKVFKGDTVTFEKEEGFHLIFENILNK